MLRNLYQLVLVGCLSLFGHHGIAQNATLDVNFNSSFQTADGEDPTTSQFQAGGLVDGIRGQGVEVAASDVLQYTLSGNLQATQGSITMWVRPGWEPGEVLRRILLVDNNPRFELHVDEGASLAFAIISDQIEDQLILVNVEEWEEGDWHFLAFNWSSEKMEVYVDGVLTGEEVVGFDIPSFGDGVFQLGSTAGDEPFGGVIDELKIYDAPLTADGISAAYETIIASLPLAGAVKVTDIFGRDVSAGGLTLVDWEGPVRNPAMKYFLQGTDSLTYPIVVSLSTTEGNSSFNLPSEVASTGPSKSMTLESGDALSSFLFSIYMDEDFDDEDFDLTLAYEVGGVPRRQVVPVRVIDQDVERELSYSITVDFSEAVDSLMLAEAVQSLIVEAAEDWLYYVDGEGFDEIPAGESWLDIGGQDHNFEEKRATNPEPYSGYYLYAFGNTVDEGCVCSTGFPNRDLLQTRNGAEWPIVRIGALHLNLFGQAFETEPTGWEVVRPYDNWTQEGYVGSDMYSLAKHEIGHALVFEELPGFLEARERGWFTSDLLDVYHPDSVVTLRPNEAHLPGLVDPASQTPPYGGALDTEVMPGGREMLTKLDILIMESIGYPLRDNGVTRALSLSGEPSHRPLRGEDFSMALEAEGGIPVYHFSIADGTLPGGLALDPRTGVITGAAEELGVFEVTFEVHDYDERSLGAAFTSVIEVIGELSSAAELISFSFPDSVGIADSNVDADNRSITFTVEAGGDITNLTPIIEVSDGASISPSPEEAQDFSNAVEYTITSEDGSVSVTWAVRFDVLLSVDDGPGEGLRVYPNPATEQLTIVFDDPSITQAVVQLHNIHGQLLREATCHAGEVLTISVGSLRPGLHFLQVLVDEKPVKVTKVLIR